jgi:hypothetical protein
MPNRMNWTVGLLLVLLLPSPALAFGGEAVGFEVGARTGYAWSAGHLGAPPSGNDNALGDYVGGQLPLWLDAGVRFLSSYYVGGYFQYGFGFVNDDRQDLCRNANVDCSASDVRLGLMGRYHFLPMEKLSPWFGLGVGYEWGAFSLHQSLLGETDTDSSWSGIEIANLQVGADYQLARGFVVAPFFSVSFGQFLSTKTTTRNGSNSLTSEEDLASKSVHEWILVGLRAAFSP